MAGRYMRVAHRLDRNSFVRRSVSWENVLPIAVVAGCLFSPLGSLCFTHEFGEFAVEPQWILKKGCVSGFGYQDAVLVRHFFRI